MRARKKPFPGVQILGSRAKQKGRRKMKTRHGRERGERERKWIGEGGEGFIAALPSALNHVKAWPKANLHIKIL